MLNYYNYSNKQQDEIIKNIVVIVDTREKENTHIITSFEKYKIQYEKKKLDHGDYSFYIKANESLNVPRDLYFDKYITIERKGSLEELSTNWSKERDRFEKEVCTFKGKNILLLIENATYSDIATHNYKSDYLPKSYLATLHSFIFRYNITPIFMPDNSHSALFIYNYCKYYLREMIK